jgi:GNAT superfamily N-acetyltransferase
MTEGWQDDAFSLLNAFLRTDEHYLANSSEYGDEGAPALQRAIGAFLQHPELGFIWMAFVGKEPVGICVVSYAISTSVGGLVVKLDDVFVAPCRRRQGLALQMLKSLVEQLRSEGVRRIDTAVYQGNREADGLYKKLGFKSLREERIALVL